MYLVCGIDVGFVVLDEVFRSLQLIGRSCLKEIMTLPLSHACQLSFSTIRQLTNYLGREGLTFKTEGHGISEWRWVAQRNLLPKIRLAMY